MHVHTENEIARSPAAGTSFLYQCGREGADDEHAEEGPQWVGITDSEPEKNIASAEIRLAEG